MSPEWFHGVACHLFAASASRSVTNHRPPNRRCYDVSRRFPRLVSHAGRSQKGFTMQRFTGVLSAALLAIAALACAPVGHAADDDAKASDKNDKPNVEVDVPQLRGVTINRKEKYVDLAGEIILPLDTDWLELLACMPKSREHESIIKLVAKPSDVHGALLLIGLKPGSPFRAERQDDGTWKYFQPTGDEVVVTIRYTDKAGKEHEVAANEWIVEQQTGKKLPDNTWVFAGSKFYKVEGREIYAADVEGNIISLVNFTDEVLARKTNYRGGQDGGGGDTWGANEKAIPAVGTKITVRLRPAKKEDDKKNKD